VTFWLRTGPDLSHFVTDYPCRGPSGGHPGHGTGHGRSVRFGSGPGATAA
jgi:hypothetical protein